MSEISAFNSALSGIQKGLTGIRKNAADIASSANIDSGSGTEQLTRSIVELKENEILVKASAKVLKAVDETIGTLLDEEA